jgi:hypothetical protein
VAAQLLHRPRSVIPKLIVRVQFPVTCSMKTAGHLSQRVRGSARRARTPRGPRSASNGSNRSRLAPAVDHVGGGPQWGVSGTRPSTLATCPAATISSRDMRTARQQLGRRPPRHLLDGDWRRASSMLQGLHNPHSVKRMSSGAFPDWTQAIPCKVRRSQRSFHDPEYTRNDLGHPRNERSSPSRQTA